MSDRGALRLGVLAVLVCACAAGAQIVLYTVDVGASPNALAVDTIDDKVFVSCERSDSVYVLDATADSPEEFVIARVPVGDYPSAVVWNHADNTMWVVNKQVNSPTGSVTVIDAGDHSVIATIEVGDEPTKAVWASVPNKLYTLEHQTVTVIDCSNNQVVGTIGIPDREYSHTDMVYNHLMNRLYLTAKCSGQGGKLYVVDCTNDRVIRTVDVANGPVKICHAPSVNRMFVACSEQDRLNVVDCATDSVIAWLPITDDPTSVLWSTPPVNRIWVACGWGHTVHYMRADLLEIEGRVDTPGKNPGALLYSPHKTHVLATSEETHEIITISARIPAIFDTAKLAPFSHGPYAMALYAPMSRVFVANYWDRDPGTVSVLYDIGGIEESPGRPSLSPLSATPNPVGAGKPVMLQASGFEPSRATLADATGRTVYEGGLGRNGAVTAPEEPGVYFYTVTDGRLTLSGKFAVR